jgi:hypothetical protein
MVITTYLLVVQEPDEIRPLAVVWVQPGHYLGIPARLGIDVRWPPHLELIGKNSDRKQNEREDNEKVFYRLFRGYEEVIRHGAVL